MSIQVAFVEYRHFALAATHANLRLVPQQLCCVRAPFASLGNWQWHDHARSFAGECAPNLDTMLMLYHMTVPNHP